MPGRLDALSVRPCADCAAEQRFVDRIEAYQIVGNWQESLSLTPRAGGRQVITRMISAAHTEDLLSKYGTPCMITPERAVTPRHCFTAAG